LATLFYLNGQPVICFFFFIAVLVKEWQKLKQLSLSFPTVYHHFHLRQKRPRTNRKMFLKRETEITTVSFFSVIIYVSEKHIAMFHAIIEGPKT